MEGMGLRLVDGRDDKTDRRDGQRRGSKRVGVDQGNKGTGCLGRVCVSSAPSHSGPGLRWQFTRQP